MLDARTRCPMPPDPRFALQVLVAALDEDFASLPSPWSKYSGSTNREWGQGSRGFMSMGLLRAGVRHAVQMLATHDQVDAFLAAQVATFLKEA